MSFIYKNPTSAVALSGPEGVRIDANWGTNFSVSQVGGYQEVFYLDNLKLTFSGTGVQELSANTIPIQINVNTNTGFSFTVLTLNSDNISSGRRKLGMLVYVYETDTVYQYTIPNYEQEWNTLTGLTGSSAITQSTNSTTINARSQAGRDFISLWTGSTIEGVSGVTRNNARWRIFQAPTAATEDFEYVAINCVPGSVDVSGYTVTNNFRDTFVTIPPSFADKEIVSISASYGDINSGFQSQFAVELRNSGNTVVNSRDWNHPNNTRIFNTGFTSPLILSADCTMNISTPVELNNCNCCTITNNSGYILTAYYTGCSYPYEYSPTVLENQTSSFCIVGDQLILEAEGGPSWNVSDTPPWGGYAILSGECYTIGNIDICGSSPALGGRGYSVTLKISG